MTSSSDSKGFLSGRLGPIIVAVVVTGLVVFVACLAFWLNLGGGVWRDEVGVRAATLHSPDRLGLTVTSCSGNPRVSYLRETNVDVQVRVVASSTPFHGGGDCFDLVMVRLGKPLGDRGVVDKRTGQVVSVSAGYPYHPDGYPYTRPDPNWRVVEARGWTSQAGFSLRLPRGWELNELKSTDSYVGEVVGHGARLTFDYGGRSWSFDPADDPAHTYAVGYESIEGVGATLFISLDASAGYTGVYFDNAGGPNLNLVGQDLTPEQQRTAVAVFRSIRLLGQTSDDP